MDINELWQKMQGEFNKQNSRLDRIEEQVAKIPEIEKQVAKIPEIEKQVAKIPEIDVYKRQTPYYAAATWFGYDTNEEVRGFSQNPAGQIWDAVMTDIHKNLANASFTKPSGIVEQTVCKRTGCLATTGCTETYKEIFSSNNLPEKCQGHGSQLICSESGKVATDYCSQSVSYTHLDVYKRQMMDT